MIGATSADIRCFQCQTVRHAAQFEVTERAKRESRCAFCTGACRHPETSQAELESLSAMESVQYVTAAKKRAIEFLTLVTPIGLRISKQTEAWGQWQEAFIDKAIECGLVRPDFADSGRSVVILLTTRGRRLVDSYRYVELRTVAAS